MTNWLREGEKFSLIGLQVDADSSVSDGPIDEGLEAYSSLKLDTPGHWREWLGTIRVEDVEACTLILVSRRRSRTPSILDGENQALSRKVGLWYTELMLACPLDVWQDPITAGGALHDGELDFREFGTLHAPHGSTIGPRSQVTIESLVEAARVASVIEQLVTNPEANRWRLMRCLQIYQEARKLFDPMDASTNSPAALKDYSQRRPGRAGSSSSPGRNSSWDPNTTKPWAPSTTSVAR